MRNIAVIPAYNEAKTIQKVIDETRKYVDLVVVVDDGSHDGTANLAREAGAFVISHHKNMGKGMALNTGFQTAASFDADMVIILDGDEQHNPADIPLLTDNLLQNQLDMVIGSRYLKKNHIPGYRCLGLFILNTMTNIGSGLYVTDSQSGFRVFSKRALRSMFFRENGFAVESEMQFLAAKYSLKVGESPIGVAYSEKAKRSPVVHGFSVLWRVFILFKEYKLQ